MHVCEFRIDTTDYFLFLYDFLSSFLLLELLSLFFGFILLSFALHFGSRGPGYLGIVALSHHALILVWLRNPSHYTATGLGCTLPRSPIRVWDALFRQGIIWGAVQTPNRLGFRVTDYALWWSLIHGSHIVRNTVAFGWGTHLYWSQWWLFHRVYSAYHALFILDLSSFQFLELVWMYYEIKMRKSPLIVKTYHVLSLQIVIKKQVQFSVSRKAPRNGVYPSQIHQCFSPIMWRC